MVSQLGNIYSKFLGVAALGSHENGDASRGIRVEFWIATTVCSEITVFQEGVLEAASGDIHNRLPY